MQQLGLSEENIIEPKKSFWRRQFQTKATKSQKTFDWSFGVILPVLCVFFDPIVFKSNGFGEALLANFKPFAYILSFVSIMSLAAFLLWGKKLEWLNAFLAGLFLAGGFISLGVGIILTPFSFVGLLFGIGILGFTPLFSAFVYLRNSYRAGASANLFVDKKFLVHALALSAIFSVAVPWVFNIRMKRAMNRLTKGDAQTIRYEAQRLKYVAPLVNFDALLNRYRNERYNTEEKRALAEAYETLAGENAETKIKPFSD